MTDEHPGVAQHAAAKAGHDAVSSHSAANDKDDADQHSDAKAGQSDPSADHRGMQGTKSGGQFVKKP